MAELDPQLLALLACPACKGGIELCDEEICCHSCQLAYPIRGQIPVMLVTEARPLRQQ